MSYHCVRFGGRECDGCGACKEEPSYRCPICKHEVCETVFVNDEGVVIGCEHCAEIKEPHEVLSNEINEW